MTDEQIVDSVQSLPQDRLVAILIRQLVEVRAELSTQRTLLTQIVATQPGANAVVVEEAVNGVLAHFTEFWDAKIEVLLLGLNADEALGFEPKI